MNPFQDDIDGAREAIKEDGCPCQWWTPAEDDPNVAPWREGEGEATVRLLDAAIFSPKDLGFGSGSYGSLADGTEIPTSAEIAMFAAEPGFTPELTDWVELPNSGKCEVVRLDRLAPNDIPILWFAWIVR